jgi:predicted LPLAT superfamily acyltransferase
VALWKGKTRGTPLGYKIFIFALKYFGLSFAYFLLYFVAFYFFLFSPRSYKAISFYFRKIHKYGKVKSLISIYKNYRIFGQSLLDKTAVMAGITKSFSFDFDGEEYLHQMAADKGGFLISAHIGNFEMAGNMLNRVGNNINIIMLDAEHENIKELLGKVITKKKVNIIPLKDDLSHLFKINAAIGNKEIICLHGDRFLDTGRTIVFPFMGKKATFPAGPFHMALSYGIPISFVFAMKDSSFHYHFYATPPKVYLLNRNRLDRKSEIHEILTDYISELEKMLKKYPLQWYNYYQFWEPENYE